MLGRVITSLTSAPGSGGGFGMGRFDQLGANR